MPSDSLFDYFSCVQHYLLIYMALYFLLCFFFVCSQGASFCVFLAWRMNSKPRVESTAQHAVGVQWISLGRARAISTLWPRPEEEEESPPPQQQQQKKKEIRCHLSLYYIYNIISIAYSLSYSLVPLSSNFLSQRIPPEMYIHINRDETGTNSLRIYTGVCFVSLPILHDAIWWRRQTLENKRQLCVLLPYNRGAFLLLVVCWLSFLFGCI